MKLTSASAIKHGLIKCGDTFRIEGFIFEVVRINKDRLGLAYRDENYVTHIRWVSIERALEVMFKGV